MKTASPAFTMARPTSRNTPTRPSNNIQPAVQREHPADLTAPPGPFNRGPNPHGPGTNTPGPGEYSNPALAMKRTSPAFSMARPTSRNTPSRPNSAASPSRANGASPRASGTPPGTPGALGTSGGGGTSTGVTLTTPGSLLTRHTSSAVLPPDHERPDLTSPPGPFNRGPMPHGPGTGTPGPGEYFNTSQPEGLYHDITRKGKATLAKARATTARWNTQFAHGHLLHFRSRRLMWLSCGASCLWCRAQASSTWASKLARHATSPRLAPSEHTC